MEINMRFLLLCLLILFVSCSKREPVISFGLLKQIAIDCNNVSLQNQNEYFDKCNIVVSNKEFCYDYVKHHIYSVNYVCISLVLGKLERELRK